MNSSLLDLPQFSARSHYHSAVERMVSKLKSQPGLLAVFQIGGVSDPGISDLDMVVVFENGMQCHIDPLSGLSRADSYLFKHGLYGTSLALFEEAQAYTFFHNYNLLWGSDIFKPSTELTPAQATELQAQTALEFLVKMYYTLSTQVTYKIVKVRALLLEAKALKYDLDFLDIKSGQFFDLVQTVIAWRACWFQNRPDKQTVLEWLAEFYREFTAFMTEVLETRTFWLPESRIFDVTQNIRIIPSDRFQYIHEGIVLPHWFGVLGTRYFSFLHRINRHHLEIQALVAPDSGALRRRFELLSEMKQYNTKNLPNFSPLVSSLNIF